MKPKSGAIEFFQKIPDEVLIRLAMYDWESLERLCVALTLDVQILKESKDKNLKRGLAS